MVFVSDGAEGGKEAWARTSLVHIDIVSGGESHGRLKTVKKLPGTEENKNGVDTCGKARAKWSWVLGS